MAVGGPHRQFSAARWASDDGVFALEPIDAAMATRLAAGITAIDPWRRMGYAASAMAAYLAASAAGACRRAICHHGGPICAMVVSHPWLRGPCLGLLALLPHHQGHGCGAMILDWRMAQEATGPAPAVAPDAVSPRATSLRTGGRRFESSRDAARLAIVTKTAKEKPANATHWSARTMADATPPP